MKKIIEVIVIANFFTGLVLTVLLSFMSGFYISGKISESKKKTDEGPKTFIIPRSKGYVPSENKNRLYDCQEREEQGDGAGRNA